MGFRVGAHSDKYIERLNYYSQKMRKENGYKHLKKILFIIGRLNPIGGEERSLSLLSGELAHKKIYDMTIACLEGGQAVFPLDEAIRVIYLTQHAKSRPARFKYLTREIKNGGYNLIVGYGASSRLPVSIIGRLYKIPVIYCERTNPLYWNRRLKGRIWYNLGAFLLRGKNGIFQSDGIKKLYKKLDKVAVIPNFIDTKTMPPADAWHSRRNIVMNAGECRAVKNQALLIRAFASAYKEYSSHKEQNAYKEHGTHKEQNVYKEQNAYKEHSSHKEQNAYKEHGTHKEHSAAKKEDNRQDKEKDFRLEIYGDGVMKPELNMLIGNLEASDIISIKPVDLNIYGQMNRGKIYVCSSDTEGYPNALLEAMAMGMACISTGCSYCVDELIKNGENGLIIPAGDENALAEALVKLMSDDDAAQRLTADAANIRRSNDIAIITDKWISFFEDVMRSV